MFACEKALSEGNKKLGKWSRMSVVEPMDFDLMCPLICSLVISL